jgi:hypothetical protein
VRSTKRPVRRFLFAQLAFILILAGIARVFWGYSGAISALLGGGVSMMNAVGTAFAWPRMLEKKDVALSLSIIVSKFALSIGVFYWLTLPSAVVWFGDQTVALGSASGTLVAFALGLASVVPAALVVATGDLSPANSTEEDSET